MRTSSLKHIAVLLFVIVMTNMCVWSFSADRLAHALEHVSIAQVADAHGYTITADSDGLADIDNDGDERAAGLVAHQVLHAIDHLQFFPDTTPGRRFLSAGTNIASLHFTEHVLPLPARDPLFRPPRRLSA
ncbi:hypothetical protein QN362_04805 [Actimicrobium sp. CCC2.4]|uniref:hypothetical protein n=1 Tax=Actimicrobium sp. CCC2.4 TaxID=3048606 RepID=UPI002AC8D125|nr:hypothetical protein [Actimicrobium sp. CCC2.4]MEB0134645.1 hypothetical protein [Actimicrobium sp. CCC2.4]WPX30589.1 hypothetical protein RHM62_09890 [Actimicrobium sp. CCC2.4]